MAIKAKRDSMIPIMNPMEVYSPYLTKFGHELINELEKKQANEDTNMASSGAFVMRDGDDSAEIFTEVGKALPLKMKQLATTQKTRIEYTKKIAKLLVARAIGKPAFDTSENTAYQAEMPIEFGTNGVIANPLYAKPSKGSPAKSPPIPALKNFEYNVPLARTQELDAKIYTNIKHRK